MTKKLRKIIEKEGWKIYEDGDIVELSQYSPLGEDYSFAVEKKNITCEIVNYAENFDYEEHASIWIEHRGTNGVPSSIQAILDDAKSIGDMLDSLSNKIIRAYPNHF